MFSQPVQRSKIDQIQSRLMLIASLVVVSLGLVLTLAPAIRNHAGIESFQFSHWRGVFVWCLTFWLLQRQTVRKLPKRDPYLLPIVSLLTGIGLMTIWRLYPYLGNRQTIWIGVSTLVVLVGLNYPAYFNYLRRYKYIWLVLGLVLTGFTIIFGTHPLGSGANRWLEVYGLHLQPSEPLKLLLIIYLASFFSDQAHFLKRKIDIIFPTIIVIALALILLIFQRDLGTAAIFLLIYIAFLFTSQGDRKIIWAALLLLFIAGIVGYLFVDIVHQRIHTWLHPFGDPTGGSYQIVQSLIAIAEGGLFGTGLGLGSPKLVPVSASDFIFTSISEELGLLGTTAIILLIVLFITRGIKLAKNTNNSFYRYLSLGLVLYFGIQSILIIGGNIGLLPLTGVPLPFLSAGGSSLLVSFCGFLFLLTISNQTRLTEGVNQIQLPRFTAIGSFLIGLLILEIIVTSISAFWFNSALTNRPENLRWAINDLYSQRGNILDRNNQILITNTGDVGSYQRKSLHTPLYSVIGYTSPLYGQTGIESSMFKYLRGLTGHTYSTIFWHKLLYNQPPQGLDVRLTIDLELQAGVDELMAGNNGAAILINASSGEIIAMSSSPYFDTSDFESGWDNLVNDPNAPLVNRATQGLYQPGTTLFPFLVTIQPDLIQIPPETYLQLNKDRLDCAITIEDDITWNSLIINGCAGAQSVLINNFDQDALRDLFQNLGFFTSPVLHLPVAKASSFDSMSLSLDEEDNSMVLSPLQMALAASALTNQGIVPGPRIVNAVQDAHGEWITLPKLQSNVDAIQANLVSVVNDLLMTEDFPYWQILSFSKTNEGDSAAWYVAGTYSNWQGQPVVVVVVLENNTPEAVQTIGRMIVELAIRKAR